MTAVDYALLAAWFAALAVTVTLLVARVRRQRRAEREAVARATAAARAARIRAARLSHRPPQRDVEYIRSRLTSEETT